VSREKHSQESVGIPVLLDPRQLFASWGILVWIQLGRCGLSCFVDSGGRVRFQSFEPIPKAAVQSRSTSVVARMSGRQQTSQHASRASAPHRTGCVGRAPFLAHEDGDGSHHHDSRPIRRTSALWVSRRASIAGTKQRRFRIMPRALCHGSHRHDDSRIQGGVRQTLLLSTYPVVKQLGVFTIYLFLVGAALGSRLLSV